VSGLRPILPAVGVATIAGLVAGAAHAQGPVIEHHVAVLQGLDKVTARISPVRAPLDTATTFGTLEIVARTCRETPPTEPPESAAFLEIRELPPASDPDGPRTELFSGWMFASSPAVSALEHPVYDVWVVDCEEPIEVRPDDLPDNAPDDQGATESTPPTSQ
jgi:hypothetical protein